MRFEIAFHKQHGRMGVHFPQQSMLDEQPQVLIDSCERNGRSPPANFRKYSFHRVMPRCGGHGFINNLPLMRGGEAALPGKIAKLFVS